MRSVSKTANFSQPPYDFVCDYLRKSHTTALLSFDDNGIITEANSFICQQLFREDLVGADIRDFLNPKHHALFDPDSPVALSPLVLTFERKGGCPLLLFSHVYHGSGGFLVIGDQARLADDQILRKISLLNNELTNLSRDSRRKYRYEQIAKQDLKEQKNRLNAELATRKQELLKSESRYQSLFEKNATVMLLIDPVSLFILDANPAACAYYGYERDTMKRMRITEINQLDDAHIAEEVAAAQKQQRHYFRFRHRLASGDVREVEVYSGPIDIHGQQCLYSLVHDVTDRHQLDMQLRESERRFRLLADHTYDCEFWVSPQGGYEYISPSCERITGYAPQEFISDPGLLCRIIKPEHRDRIEEHCFPASINRTGFHSVEFLIVTKGGEECWLEHRCFPFFDEQGHYAGRRGSHRDITLRKKAEMQRLELESQLAQKHKIEALGLMASGMAHNFNNNLSIILGGIDLALIKLPDNGEIPPLLDNAKTAVLRSRDLIRKIMTYSRQGEFKREPVQPAQVVEETLELLSSTIPSTVRVLCQADALCHDLRILADPVNIQEALINLCNNASQAMNERGEIIIHLNVVELQQNEIPARYPCHPGAYWQLSVQDNGCGMPEDIIEKIFDPFFTTKSVEHGTGMGLATIQGIMLRHEGLIKVKSLPGQGSTFELYFPINDNTAQTESSLRTTALAWGSEKILFVDDEQLLADLGQYMLSELGYQVSTMTESSEALKLFQANPDRFDLVITDQTMPDMTGEELIHKLRQIRPNLPVILCTGFSNKVDAGIAEKLEINAFLMKPLELSQLAQTVRAVLDGIDSSAKKS
ncbi:MAG: PAS domain S-box protein [Desulfuromonadales bacterium]|nr:PAS domain S-box protein [Desulfuromonadales bacterium]MBN2793044.1 PAS domain S-box protein [Desulfuromonadales bacterium]